MTHTVKQERINDAFRALQQAGRCKNKKEFAEMLGVNYVGLTRAMNGDTIYLTDSLLAKVAALEAGTINESSTADSLLLIPTGARAGTIADFCEAVHEYDCERIISPVKGADFALQVAGDSMSPEYPSGSQIIVKKINEAAFVEWGKVYVLDTDNGPIMKIVRRTSEADVVECVSINPAYQPFTVHTSFIRGWYRVIMVLALK